MRGLTLIGAVSALALTGCSTYSFGPPQVSQSRETINQDVSETCLAPSDGTRLKRNVEGALDLIDNYVGAYRCTLRMAADGRQAWQVPGFLSLITATMAAALGGGRDWAIAGGSANAMFNAGNAYYDNVGQAAIIQDALKSFSCIQTAAVGAESFIKIPEVQNAPAAAREKAAAAGVAAAEERLESARNRVREADKEATLALNLASDAEQKANKVEANSATASQAELFSARQTAAARRNEAHKGSASLQAAQTAMAGARDERASALAELAEARDVAATLGTVTITAEQQYFNMVAAALQRVEATAAGRLSKRGTYKPEDVVTLIEALAKKAKEAEDAAKKDRQANMGTVEGLLASNRAVAVMTQIELELAALQPKLDKCLVHAAG